MIKKVQNNTWIQQVGGRFEHIGAIFIPARDDNIVITWGDDPPQRNLLIRESRVSWSERGYKCY